MAIAREPGTCWPCYRDRQQSVKLVQQGEMEFNNRSVEVITTYQCPACGHKVRIST